jgi:type IV pilus assembly protein PilW
LSAGIAKGSDVLVLRTVVGRPMRLAADADGVASKYQIQIETVSGGTCTDGTSKVSGFCANSHALIASCSAARVFQVSTAASAVGSSTLNITATSAGLGTDHYAQATSEVFPLQTIVYYVAPSARGNTQSLYRRVFDGNDGATGLGEEQELIEDVENLQVTYGVDNPATTLNTDGTPDLTVDSYEKANAVTDWSRVVAVRMSLLIKARDPVRADASVPASAPVNGVTINFPTTGDKFDRRVFTTTVALRNKVAY